MKNYVMLILLCLFVHQNLWAKIKNGYEVDLNAARQLLVNLQGILEKDKLAEETKKLSLSQEGEIKAKIKWLEEYICYYQLTEELLEQFRSIAPDLYDEIDTIKDSKGRTTHVYVKFIHEELMKASVAGTTNLSQVENDKHAYHSEYGAQTVSVKVMIGQKALRVFAHELGHVKYQVPHLASYANYCRMNYLFRKQRSNYIGIGHDPQDPSGLSACRYEKRFSEHYSNYIKSTNVKVISPLVLLQDIKGSLVTHIHGVK